jgi:hypothetical protein
VDEIGQQRDAAGRDEHDALHDRRGREDCEREHDGSHAVAGPLDRVVNESVAVAVIVLGVPVLKAAVSVQGGLVH